MSDYTRIDRPRSGIKVASDESGVCLVKGGPITTWLTWEEAEDLRDILNQLFSGGRNDG